METSATAQKDPTKDQPTNTSMQDEDEPYLDLSEALKRAIVRGPDDKPYELRTPEEFSVEDEHLLRSELERFSELQQLSKLTPRQSTELKLRLNNAFEKLFVGDAAAKALFNDRKRQRVLLFFRTRWAREDADAVRSAIQQMETETEGADSSTMAS